MRYRVLGPVTAADDTGAAVLGGPRGRAVLAMLLSDAGRVITDERLVAGIWGDHAPRDAQHAIENHVSRLRRAVDDDIVRTGGGYRLAVDPTAVDAHRFDVLLASARERLADAPAAAGALLRDALALWHGEPYADVGDIPGLQQEIRRLTAARLSAVEDRVQADLDVGGNVEVAAELEALIREHPFRERLRAMHMLALYRAGRQAEALAAFQRTRALLSEELGIDPSPDLVDLHRRILTQDPGLQLGEMSRTQSPGSTTAGDGGLPTVRGFEIREHMGDGDFGSVYRAYHSSLGREVALKILHPELSDLPDVVRSFERRAQRVAQLDHPHVLPLLDSWRDPGAVHLVTPWVPAGSVRHALRHGPWSPAATLRMLEQVGAALDHAHRRGVVHGDVKTANIVLSSDGNARLVDFAMTPRLRDAHGAPRTNDLGAIPPEQRRGLPPTTAGDVYGLAAVAIEALTGQPVHAEQPGAALRDHERIPGALVQAIEAATATDPAQRPARVADLLRRLRRALGADVVAPASLANADELAAVRNPYKGLHAFGEDDVVDFFGREEVVRRLLEAIGEHPLVAVVGPSGSGKSSIVRAGVVPALRSGWLPGSEQWLIASLFPGSHPFDELAVALRRVAVDPPDDLAGVLTADTRGLARAVKQILPGDDARLLLIIDQFEELFSLTHDASVRRAFLDSLTELAADARSRVRTIVTLRADFFGRPLEHHGFGELIRAGLVSVTVPSRDDLARAVTAPARNVGVELESGLVGRIVADVVDQPGGLPLLQYALTELFARRDGRSLTAQAYDEAGGVRGALGRRAEELYAALPSPQQTLARQIFLRLVTVDDQAGATRRRVHRSALTRMSDDRAAVDGVLQRFGAHRLLTYDHDPVTRGATVEVAHEALLTEWGRLRRWIADRRDDLLLHQRLTLDTAEWQAADRADAFLARGGRLEQLVRFAASTDLAVNPDEREFVEVSARYDADVARQRRRQRRLVAIALAGAVVFAAALLALGLMQRERDAVRGELQHAASLAAASHAAQTTDADLAVLLAGESVHASRAVGGRPAAQALGALHEAVLSHRLDVSFDVDHFSVHFLDEQRLITPSTPGGAPNVWDIASGSRPRTLDRVPGDGDAHGHALSADGRLWAEVHTDAILVWEVATGQIVQRIPAPSDGLDRPEFDPTGEVLAVNDAGGDGPNVVRVFDVVTGAERQQIPLMGGTRGHAISPDGRTLAATNEDEPIVELFDISTGERRDVLHGPAEAESANSVAFDAARGALVVVYGPGLLQLHDLSAGAVVGTARLDTEPLDVCFSDDGTAVAVTSLGAIDVFDGATARPVTRILDTSFASLASCDADGTRVAGGSVARRARIWDITRAGEAEVWSAATTAPLGAAWVDDAIITMHADQRLRRFVPGRGLTATSGIATPTENPYPLVTDGVHRLATYSRAESADGDQQDSTVIRDARTLQVVRELPTEGEPHAFGADGTSLIVSAFDWVEIVDTATGASRGTLDEEWSGNTPPDGAFLSDGRHAVVDDMGRTSLFDLHSGQMVAEFCAAAFPSRVEVSPADGLFAVDGPRGVEIYDAAQVLSADLDTADDCRGRDPVAATPVAFVAGNDVRAMSFSQDGTQLSTVSDDGTLSLWDPRSGALRFSVRHDANVRAGTFSDDGRHIVVTVDDPDGDTDTVRVYTLDVDELLGIADDIVTRGFTADECAAYNISDPCGATP